MEQIRNPQYENRFIKHAPDIWRVLQNTPRTGWVIRGVENPESVADHCEDMITRFSPLLKQIPELSPQDIVMILHMFEVHDWPEADPRVGDIPLKHVGYSDGQITPETKRAMEHGAMTQICDNLTEGKIISAIWNEYEAQETFRSQIAYQCDKIHPVIKAIHYEIEQNKPGLAQEFFTSAEKKILNPVLRDYLLDHMNNPFIQQV